MWVTASVVVPGPDGKWNQWDVRLLQTVGASVDDWPMIERTGLDVISDDECWELAATKTVGRLAVSIKNRPDIFPVNYRVVDGALLLRTAPGVKLAAATLGSGIAFEIDDLDENSHHGWSVVIHGTAHELDRLDDLLEAEATAVETWATSTKNRFVRIEVEEISGRRVPEDD